MPGILLLYVAAIGLGAFATRSWRRRGLSVSRGYGFIGARMGALDFCVGVLISAVAIVGIYLVEQQLGATRLVAVAPDFAALGGVLALLLVMAALEEFLFRSLLLSGLVLILGDRKMLAVALSAIAFGAIHLANPHATYVSAFGNALGGVMYCVAFLGARSFWLPLGMHFSWNFVQGPMLGFPVSGQHFASLAEQHTTGAALLTGGDYGPEAGLIGMASRFVIIGLVVAYLAVRPKDKDAGIDAAASNGSDDATK